MRGLKLTIKKKRIIASVASFTDAWIETASERFTLASVSVASFTDAWIETQRVLRSASTFKSHLLQMRGLKLLIIPKSINRLLVASFTDAWIETAMAQEFFRNAAVASFTDAWIETFLEVSALIFLVSHLLQMRGLKQQKE